MSERRHVGIRDVARAAGVSITTVSHALNAKAGVSEETRRRVREVADQLGYRPDPRGRHLASGRTGLIALTVSMPDGVHAPVKEFEHNANLIDAATATAIARGLALVIVPAGEASIWGRLPLDGLIVVDPVPDDPAIRELDRSACSRSRGASPTSWTAWVPTGPGANAVGSSRGSTQRRKPTGSSDTWERLESISRSAAASCLDRPDVPGDLMISSLADLGLAARSHPAITTLELFPRDLGAAAAELLADLVVGTSLDTGPVVVPTTVVARASTARV